jgi:hypothetical protein
VRGAGVQGFDSLYVGTGLKEHGEDFEEEVAELLAAYGEAGDLGHDGLKVVTHRAFRRVTKPVERIGASPE